MTLRKKMLLSVGGLTALLLVLLQALSLLGARNLSRDSLQATSLLLARYQAEKVRSSLAFAEASSEAILRTVEISHLLDEETRLQAYLREIMEGNGLISALELHPSGKAPVVLRRTNEGILRESEPTYGEAHIERRTLDEQLEGAWVVSSKAMELAKAYHIQSRGGVRLFIEIPFHLLAAPIEVAEGTAYGFLASDRKVYFDSRLAGLEQSPQWSDFSSQIILGPIDGEGFHVGSDPLHHRPAWVGTARVGDLPLKAGVVYLESVQFDLVREIVLWMAGLSFIGVILVVAVINILTNGIVSPLEQLCAKVDAAAESDFEGKIDPSPRASSEVVGLAKSFNRLMDDIRAHMGELESAVARRQALESELAIASRIQESIMPSFPFECEVAVAVGVSYPARQVGGDFMGVFRIDESRSGFFLGDVSGKGIPAAIYMAFTASLLEHLGRLDVSPQETFHIVNQALCARHEHSMFATVFFGILDGDGTVTYCNAGHHAPLIVRRDGSVREPDVASGLAVGIFDYFEYGESSFQLEEGERLLLFTDGLTEAMNCSREEFGEERLRQVLGSAKTELTLEQMVDQLNAAVTAFREGAEPNDDFTFLFVKRR